jgi:hypothetical protein
MASGNYKASVIAILAGIFLLISGMNGLATMQAIKDFVTEHIFDNEIIQLVFVILILIASLGGIAVIAGGILIAKNRLITGRLIIAIGVGLGLIGLIFSIILAIMEGEFTITSFFTIGAVGIMLSIVARMIAKKQ